MFDFVHEFDLAARPSVSEISTFLAAEQCSNDVKRDNVKLTTECQQGSQLSIFCSAPCSGGGQLVALSASNS